MHNYDERGTFKIYRSFVFGEANFERECSGQEYNGIKIAIF